MTKKEFDTYKFSIKTEVMYKNNWYKIREIDFLDGWICLETGRHINFSEVENILY